MRSVLEAVVAEKERARGVVREFPCPVEHACISITETKEAFAPSGRRGQGRDSTTVLD